MFYDGPGFDPHGGQVLSAAVPDLGRKLHAALHLEPQEGGTTFPVEYSTTGNLWVMYEIPRIIIIVE